MRAADGKLIHNFPPPNQKEDIKILKGFLHIFFYFLKR